MINRSTLLNVPNVVPPNGPGGNPIVPTPATPNDWPKMLIAIAIVGGGIWLISELFDDEAAKWVAILAVLAIITYYETHGNQRFSQGITNLLGSFR